MELILKSKTVIENLKDLEIKIKEGEVDALEVYATVKPVMDALDKFKKSISSNVMDEAYKYQKNEVAFGFGIDIRNGGETLNYGEDGTWANLKAHLAVRESLLKTALKSPDPIFDSEGIEVPKVSTKQRANSVVLNKIK